MEGPRDYYTKWSKSERERQIYGITYTWNLKNNTNEIIYETETNLQTWKTDYGYQWEKNGRDKLGVWD